ncbi:radical SAM protein [bacterium]|nr:radical SAM protein [bacterium]
MNITQQWNALHHQFGGAAFQYNPAYGGNIYLDNPDLPFDWVGIAQHPPAYGQPIVLSWMRSDANPRGSRRYRFFHGSNGMLRIDELRGAAYHTYWVVVYRDGSYDTPTIQWTKSLMETVRSFIQHWTRRSRVETCLARHDLDIILHTHQLALARHAFGIVRDGVTYQVLDVQGCSIRCTGCNVPHLHPPEGIMTSVMSVAHHVLSRGDPLCISGGEPFDQAASVLLLCRVIKRVSPHLGIRIETGRTWERLNQFLPPEQRLELHTYVDVLLDGPYDEDHRTALLTSATTNQRLIDVYATVRTGRVVCIEQNQHSELRYTEDMPVSISPALAAHIKAERERLQRR